MNRYAKESVAREFAAWAELDPALVDAWIATFVECDVMFAHGKGHQSLSKCEKVEANHLYHTYEDMEAGEGDISGQVYTRKDDGKVFRLVFNDRGWWN